MNHWRLVRRSTRLGSLWLAAAALLVPLAPARAAGYTVTPIVPRVGGFGDYRINHRGQVAGLFSGSDGALRAFRWSPISPNALSGSLQALPTYKSAPGTAAYGLNDLGDVVGAALYNSDVNPATALFWPSGGGVQVIGPSTGQNYARAINTQGDILSDHYSATRKSENGIAVSRVVGGKRKFFYLGGASGRDLNDAGQVLGSLSDGAVGVWSPTSSTTWNFKLIAPSGATGFSLNASGEVVYQSPVSGLAHPFLYLPVAKYGLPAGGNDLWDLVVAGLPAPPPGASWTHGYAYGLNDNGLVVGRADSVVVDETGRGVVVDRVFWLWDSVNGTRSLSAQLPAGWSLLPSNLRVNNAGQIVGVGTDGTGTYCVLLTPVP